MGCSSSLTNQEFDLSTPYKEVRFLHKESRNTDRYFHHLYERIGSAHTAEEGPHIRKAIEALVGSLLESAGSRDPRVRTSSSNLMMVGPFYEGVKIGFIDEFQYVAVLEEFSPKSKGFMVEEFGGLSFGVYIPEEVDKKLFNSWRKVLKDGFLKSYGGGKKGSSDILNIFCSALRNAARDIKPEVTPFGHVTIADDTAAVIKGTRIEVKFVFRQTVVSIFQGKKVEEHQPHGISVLITPAIRIKEIEEFIHKEDLIDEHFLQAIEETGTFLLVPCQDGNFRGVFTETEHRIMQDLSPEHKKAFVVLQYLILGVDDSDGEVIEGRYDIFDLEIVTAFMVHLHSSCPCLKPRFPDHELFDCVLHVLNLMYASLYESRADESDVMKNLAVMVQLKWNAGSVGNTRGPTPNSKLFWNRVYFRELLWHDLRNWIGTLEKYNLKLSRPLYGAVPLNRKLLQAHS